MPRFVVGVMGAGDNASSAAMTWARELGQRIASAGWVVLSGGRNCGVMQAVNQGAKQIPQSLTIGILPSTNSIASPDLDIIITTDLHSGRNNINVLSSRVVVVCGEGGAGTASEIALAIKANKPVILLGVTPDTQQYFQRLGGAGVQTATTPREVMEKIQTLFPEQPLMLVSDAECQSESD